MGVPPPPGVGAHPEHPDGYQYGVSIQISINLGKTLLRMSCTRKIDETLILYEQKQQQQQQQQQRLVILSASASAHLKAPN